MMTVIRRELAPESSDSLKRIYKDTRTIAVVGASASADKPAHRIPSYLQSQGYTVVPVNPRGGEIVGERVHTSLLDIDVRVDVVEVFRPPTEAEAVARDAIAIGAGVLWFQLGTHTEEAVRLAGCRSHRRRRPVHGRHPW